MGRRRTESGSATDHVGRLPRAAATMTRLAYQRARAAGVKPDALLRKADLTREVIENQQARVSVRDQIRFLNLVADALDDEYLGFRLAQTPDLREIGLLYYVVASSETLVDAFQRAARYSSIVNEGIALTVIDGTRFGLSLRYVDVGRHLDRHQMEFWMVAIVRMCRQLTGLRLRPSRVRLIHNRRRGDATFSDLLGTNIEFGAAMDEIVFETRSRHLPVGTADPYLHALLIRHCEEALAHRPAGRNSFRSKVENEIVPLLPHGKAQASEVARRLGVSQRSLTRRLSLEKLNYSTLMQNLRADLANRYLADSDLSISQVAWLLGYREVGAFSHAFKRWTGMAPREARPHGASA
jgi:AraC-like DNA-binding protein